MAKVKMPLRFNPTMVRLRPATTSKIGYPPKTPFQSHYGAIATVITDLSFQEGNLFQSHYGAIATKKWSWGLKTREKVSIPLWCDCDL